MKSVDPVLGVSNLSISFFTLQGQAKALERVSFEVYPEEILGIVGESGSGKSVSCLSILQLIPFPPGKIENGRIMGVIYVADVFRTASALALTPETSGIRNEKHRE